MAEKLKPYKAYVPVVYDYVKELPLGWQLLPNVAIFEERKEKGTENEIPLSISAIKGIIRSSDYEDRKDRTSEDKSEYLLVKEGDLAYNTMLMWAGAVGYSKFRGIVSPAYTVLKAKKGIKLNPKFFHYQFRLEYYKNYSRRFSYGIIDSRLRLYYIHFKRMYSIMPPFEIQNKIVQYLDNKNNKIEKFIRNKERLISLLEEENDFAFENAIFYGLSENIKLKETGFELLPFVPASWKIKKVKHVAKINPGKALQKYSKNSDEEVVFLPMERVSEDGEISNEIKKPIKDLWSGFTYFAKNDIIMAKITPCFENGKGAYLDKLETEIGFGSTEFHVLRSNKLIEPLFLYFLIRTKKFMILGEENMQGSAGQQRVPTDFVKNFTFGLPSLDEQKEIISFIKNRIIKSSEIISKARSEIAAIKEYREALITDLVTGKRSLGEEVSIKQPMLLEEAL